jgi:electron transfer flavoprotein alpha subunit
VRTDLAVVLVKAGAVVSRHVDAEAPLAPEVRAREVAVSGRATRVRVVERTPQAPSDRPDLGSADVVVVGGRGTEGDFGPLEALADEIGGAVGATRVATDEGWIGHEAQIGQTGVTVSPRLYVGAGVSGAVHHRGGMQASGTIVAVNSDPEAPIFEIADYGVVGDLFAVLPQLTEELRRLRNG